MNLNTQKLVNYRRFLEEYGKAYINGHRAKLLDIATGHGRYAVMARLLEYDVTAFDARPDRIPTYYPGINWQVANLKDFDFSGYDVINCLGIFYHLPLGEQFKLLQQINYTLVILDTHYVTNHVKERDGTIDVGEYTGIVCKEGDDLETMQKEKLLNAFDDLENFCHTQESLYRIFKNFGFKVIDTAYVTDDRNFYILEPIL